MSQEDGKSPEEVYLDLELKIETSIEEIQGMCDDDSTLQEHLINTHKDFLILSEHTRAFLNEQINLCTTAVSKRAWSRNLKAHERDVALCVEVVNTCMTKVVQATRSKQGSIIAQRDEPVLPAPSLAQNSHKHKRGGSVKSWTTISNDSQASQLLSETRRLDREAKRLKEKRTKQRARNLKENAEIKLQRATLDAQKAALEAHKALAEVKSLENSLVTQAALYRERQRVENVDGNQESIVAKPNEPLVSNELPTSMSKLSTAPPQSAVKQELVTSPVMYTSTDTTNFTYTGSYSQPPATTHMYSHSIDPPLNNGPAITLTNALTKLNVEASSFHPPVTNPSQTLSFSGLPHTSSNKSVSQPPPASLSHVYHPGRSLQSEINNSWTIHSFLSDVSEAEKFAGNPIGYLAFINSFLTYYNIYSTEPGLLFEILKKRLKGKALKAIAHCGNISPPGKALQEALAILQRNYGSEDLVGDALLKNVTRSQQVTYTRDGLCEILQELESCEVLLDTPQHRPLLNSPHTVMQILARLPRRLQFKFGRESALLPNPSNPGFVAVLKFLKGELKIVSTPASAQALAGNQSTSKSTKPGNSKRANDKISQPWTQTVLQGNVSPGDRSGTGNSGQSTHCLACSKKGHTIQRCYNFKKQSVQERWDLVRGKKMCFRCLGSGHRSKACKADACGHCSSNGHHSFLCSPKVAVKPPPNRGELRSMSSDDSNASTVNSFSMHRNEENDGEETPDPVMDQTPSGPHMCSSMKSQQARVRVRVLPVQVYANDSSTPIQVYCLLDSGSDLTITTKSLARSLGVHGPTCDLSIAGMNSTKLVKAMDVAFDIRGFDCNQSYHLDRVICVEQLNCHSCPVPTNTDVARYSPFKGLSFPEVSPHEIQLIIGVDNYHLHQSLETRSAGTQPLFAERTPIGWCLVGRDIDQHTVRLSSTYSVARVQQVPMTSSGTLYDQSCDVDLRETAEDEATAYSVEDEEVQKLMERSCEKINGHYQLPLPFRHHDQAFNDNYTSAVKRLQQVAKYLEKHVDKYEVYVDKMTRLIEAGYLVKVDATLDVNPHIIRYLPHFCTKQSKPRIVYDGAAKFNGHSLNDMLMSGPDLTEPLLEVLMRFRRDQIAFAADIKEMFLQVLVPPDQQDCLRILWFEEHNLQGDIVEYRFTRWPFGLNCSPFAATFAKNKTAQDNVVKVSAQAVDTILRNFYVDDCLKSTQTIEEAIKLIQELRVLLQSGGFHLTKFIGNSAEMLQSLPSSELSPSLKEINLGTGEIPSQKTLGVRWDPTSDEFVIKVEVRQKPLTRRGLCSTIGQIFDPIGISQPYVLVGRHILQDVADRPWDEPISTEVKRAWTKWLDSLPCLEVLAIPRCLHVSGNRPVLYEIHTFCDASRTGLGIVSYVRYFKDGDYSCNFLFGKAKTVPKNSNVSMPRLELTAAVTAAKLHYQSMRSLDVPISRSCLWSDAHTVLKWIANRRLRLKVFVAQRVKTICQYTKPSDWHYVPTKLNPADVGSRGVSPRKATNDGIWLRGPSFLYLSDDQWPVFSVPSVDLADMELVHVNFSESMKNIPDCLPYEPLVYPIHADEIVNADIAPQLAAVVKFTDTEPVLLYNLLERYSDLHRLKKALVWLDVVCHAIGQHVYKGVALPTLTRGQTLTTTKLDQALRQAVHLVQRQHFGLAALCAIREKGFAIAFDKCRNTNIKKKLRLLSDLYPFIDNDGLLRVGGRLQNSTLDFDARHPMILPQRHHLTRLIVLDMHCHLGHSGHLHVLSLLRRRFWIIYGISSVKHFLDSCHVCVYRRAAKSQQVMAPLPPARVQPGLRPFERVGIDLWGPERVKLHGIRAAQKCYGVMYSCLTTRACHLDLVTDLSTSAFIQSLTRFLSSERVIPQVIMTDNGTNFTGAHNELKRGFRDINLSSVQEFLLKRDIAWQFSTPDCSHAGGVWERMIRSFRRIREAINRDRPGTPTFDELRTTLKEVEFILNCKPLTAWSDRPDDLPALSPMDLLSHGTVNIDDLVQPLNGADRLITRWRHPRTESDEFWTRWSDEYISNLQHRHRWQMPHRNIQVGDLVLFVEEDRKRLGRYPKALIVEVRPNKFGQVRQVKIEFLGEKGERIQLWRHVNKVALLESIDEHDPRIMSQSNC